jgi:hypothetical protein
MEENGPQLRLHGPAEEGRLLLSALPVDLEPLEDLRHANAGGPVDDEPETALGRVLQEQDDALAEEGI